MTLSPGGVRRLLDDHGLRPSRALGQNFVADQNTVRRIVRLAGVGAGSRVVEIGAGLGSLTLELAASGAEVVAIEIDRYLVPVLRTLSEPHPNVRIVEADAMRLDWAEVLGPDGSGSDGSGSDGSESVGEPWHLVANLPYNVATPLVAQILEGAPQVGSLLVMVQREVGERLAAHAGDDAYGAVSVKVAYWATASVVGSVPPTVFVPRPAVDSALVRIERRAAPAVDPSIVSYDRLFKVVAAGFAQRRKMLRRSLVGVVDARAFAAATVSPEARAEELDVQEWGRLAAWRAPGEGAAEGHLGQPPARSAAPAAAGAGTRRHGRADGRDIGERRTGANRSLP